MSHALPLIKNGALKPVLKILTDYPRDDMASDEVQQALVSAAAIHGVTPFNIDVGAVPGMDTVVAGFKTAQLGLNSKLGFGHIIHTNCAPRRNIVSNKSKGEGVVLGVLPNGVCLLTVSSGYSLSPFAPFIADGSVTFFETKIKDSGSQFRSRDYFPEATAQLGRYLQDLVTDKGADFVQDHLKRGKGADLVRDFELIGDKLDTSMINTLPQGAIYSIDNFGNIKMNIDHDQLLEQYTPGQAVSLLINDALVEGVIGKAGFSQGEGVLALTRGSSGWVCQEREMRLTEIFLRGGSAAGAFDTVKPGDQVTILAKDDLHAAVVAIRDSGLSRLRNLDLYLFSESALVKLMAHEHLIEDGFKTDRLRAALKDKTFIDVLG